MVVVEAKDLPALLIAPEEGWAIVNVLPLAADGSTNVAFRVRKELLRAFGLIGGASFMGRDAIVLRPNIRAPKDLDAVKGESYGIDAIAAMSRNLPYCGIMPWYETTYRKACQEGWAPTPTNDVQKAIWDKVHAIPANPIKIKYEGKKTGK